MHTKVLVENENYSVIYGDTDSIMVNTNTTDFRQAKQIGQRVISSLDNLKKFYI